MKGSLGPWTDHVYSLLDAAERQGVPMQECHWIASKSVLRKLQLEHMHPTRGLAALSFNDTGGTILGRPVIRGSDLETIRLVREEA